MTNSPAGREPCLAISDRDLEILARHIASRMVPDALLDAADVAALLKCQPRYVTETYARQPGFPSAIRLSGPGSRPRWQRRDIIAWIETRQTPRPNKGGRPRNPVEW